MAIHENAYILIIYIITFNKNRNRRKNVLATFLFLIRRIISLLTFFKGEWDNLELMSYVSNMASKDEIFLFILFYFISFLPYGILSEREIVNCNRISLI